MNVWVCLSEENEALLSAVIQQVSSLGVWGLVGPLKQLHARQHNFLASTGPTSSCCWVCTGKIHLNVTATREYEFMSVSQWGERVTPLGCRSTVFQPDDFGFSLRGKGCPWISAASSSPGSGLDFTWHNVFIIENPLHHKIVYLIFDL